MSFRYSSMAGPSLPHLSEIIKLEPEKEPWCAGYAPSQGRRCHNPTNARGRSSATRLLNEGTKELRAGRRIDTLLKDLAPHVLCKRPNHQNQASELVAQWQRQVHSFLRSQSPLTPSRSPARQPRGIVHSGTHEENVDEQFFAIYQSFHDATVEEFSRIQPFRHIPAVVPDPPNNASIIRNTNTRSGFSTSTESSTVMTQPTRIINQSTNTAISEATNTTRAPVSRQAEPRATLRTTAPIRPTRRPVEGDCGICLFPLQEPHSDSIDEASDAEDADDNNYDDVENNDDKEEEEEEEPLVWCKAQCGINFHKKCIDQWLETTHNPTCPACRRNWRY